MNEHDSPSPADRLRGEKAPDLSPAPPFSPPVIPPGNTDDPEGKTRRIPPGKKWEKGQSGNPSGRPKLHKEFMEFVQGKSLIVAKQLLAIALGGKGNASVRAAEVLIERAWGKAPQPITGAGGGPIEHSFKGGARMKLEAALEAANAAQAAGLTAGSPEFDLFVQAALREPGDADDTSGGA